jgi:8-oxo-dGTP diphosphatase
VLRVADGARNDAITVSAVVLRDRTRRLLTVRKRGTFRFMLPGGKPEADEAPEDAAVRECREELGLQLDINELRLLGTWHAPAANEDGRIVAATLYEHPSVDVMEPSAEIEELRWLDLNGVLPDDLAPLLVEWVLPALAAIR